MIYKNYYKTELIKGLLVRIHETQSNVINWERIRIDDETRSIFNDKLYELTKDNKILSHDYTYFNSAILIAAPDIATKERTKH